MLSINSLVHKHYFIDVNHYEYYTNTVYYLNVWKYDKIKYHIQFEIDENNRLKQTIPKNKMRNKST